MSILQLSRPQTALLANGLRLEWVEQGPRGATTILLLHGATDSWRSYEPVLPFLPGSMHVIALSQRGHGNSDKPPADYRTRTFAADVAAFAEHLGLPPMIVVGHSMGATNAFRLAIDRPDLVRGLVGIGAFASFQDKAELVEFNAAAIVPLTDPVPRELALGFQQDTIAGSVAPGLLEAMVGESLKAPAHVWRGLFDGLFEDDCARDLQSIHAPTLLLWGDADAFVPRDDQNRLASAIHNARLTVYPGVGHALHWEQPRRFAEDLIRFVETQEGWAERPTAFPAKMMNERSS